MTLDPILIVDDDPKIRKLLRTCLEEGGYRVIEAGDGDTALSAVRSRPLALITLDVGLGGDSGFDVAREIRRSYDTPIIMVSAFGDVIDRVVGLELGADDYIVKPFHSREVLARVRTVLRRGRPIETDSDPVETAPAYRFDGLAADPGKMTLVDRDGTVIDLTAGDFRLLQVFLDAPKRVLSRDTILDRMSGQSWSPYDRTVDNQVARLRKKIERDPANPQLIKTVRGIGYSFAADVTRG